MIGIRRERKIEETVADRQRETENETKIELKKTHSGKSLFC